MIGDVAIDLTPRRARPGEAREMMLYGLKWKGPGCLLWPFATTSNSRGVEYGIFSASFGKGERRPTTVHREVLRIASGFDPGQEYDACHSPGCVSRLCFALIHLRWDARRGRRHGTKLDPDKVRRLRHSAEPMREIIDDLGIDKSLAYKVRRREAWAWVED